MTLFEVIAKLQEIASEHGDVLVMHHDDWTEFLVERVEYDPGGNPDGSFAMPPHVLIEGDKLYFDGAGGLR